MQFSTLLALAGTFAASTAAVMKPRGDAMYANPTCGLDGARVTLDHDELASAATSFAAWIDAGADGQVDTTGRFHKKLGQTYGGVTIFACDSKSRNAGSIISGRLAQGAVGPGSYIDLQCGADVAGYESSNDLTIGRTVSGDDYC